MAGYRPVPREDKYFPIDAVTDYDKWDPELRILLPDRDDVEFPPDVKLQSGPNPNTDSNIKASFYDNPWIKIAEIYESTISQEHLNQIDLRNKK